MRHRLEEIFAWLLVAVQLTLIAAVVLLPGERSWSTPAWLVATALLLLAVGGALSLAGSVRLGSGFTPSPLPAPAAQLRTTGVYACVRHPIYAGLSLAGIGVVLLGGRLVRLWVLLALVVLLWFKAAYEERMLTRRFPGYPAYAAGTPRMVPNPLRCLRRGQSRLLRDALRAR